MRKNLFAAALLLAGTQLQAQVIKKGTVQTGIELSSNFDRSGIYGKSRDFAWLKSSLVRLEAGKAIKNNLVLGARLGFGNTPGYVVYGSGWPVSNSLSATPLYTGGIWLRKYAPLGKRLSLFAEGALNFTKGKTKISGFDYLGAQFIGTEKFSSLELGFSTGLAWAASKRVNVELTFNNLVNLRYTAANSSYTYTATGEVNGYRNSSVRFQPGRSANYANISLGVKVKLGRLR